MSLSEENSSSDLVTEVPTRQESPVIHQQNETVLPKRLKIALDYDDTFSADPITWFAVIRVLNYAGHDVRIVTVRARHLDLTSSIAEIEKKGIKVIWTWGVAKAFFCEHHADWVPDIWLDDKPKSILENSTASREFLEKWRLNANSDVYFIAASRSRLIL